MRHCHAMVMVMKVLVTVMTVMMLHCTLGSFAQNLLYRVRNVSISYEKPGIESNGWYDREDVLKLIIRHRCLIDDDIHYEVEQWS